jgi:hypothetical protein
MMDEYKLWDMGFYYRPETKDYVLELWKDFKIRALIHNKRAKVWVQFRVLEELEQCYDMVYLNTFGKTSLQKLIESYEVAYYLGLEKGK